MTGSWTSPLPPGSGWAGLHSGDGTRRRQGLAGPSAAQLPRLRTWWLSSGFIDSAGAKRGRRVPSAATGVRQDAVAWGPACPDPALRAWGQQVVSRLQMQPRDAAAPGRLRPAHATWKGSTW